MKNILQKINFIIILTLGCQNIYSQKLNEDYMLFSKTDEQTEYLEFKNDSVVERKPYYFRNGCGLANLQVRQNKTEFYKDYKYEKLNDTITIYDFDNFKNIVFRINDENSIENSELGIVYVRRKYYEEFPDVAVKYDNEIFWLDTRETSNGIIRKGGKKNRKLARLMRKKDTSNVKVEIFKGYEAYEKFGYKYVFGIIEVSEK
jgi:hypothetical protein